ncbi:scopoletin glucosyltransferase-like [Sesamum indicum]|uniref:Glycosyltransferase n=1 Tax=Sesamum indicum TaxID=4182 RepID=A0A6I9TR97_SESIN|nr:scopoletin glucosyltransferase-like [Sesamum indicum]
MDQLHIFLLPLTAYGHMIPALDMTKLFLSRGAKTTIITTPEFVKEVEHIRQQGFEIGIECVKFPQVGIRDGGDDAFSYQFAIYALQEPVEELLERLRPDCLVADMFFPWASDAAAKFNIPRLAFHGTSCFAVSVAENMRLYRPFEKVSTDFEPFVVPDLPHQITFYRTQVSANDRGEIKSDFDKVLEEAIESVKRSYGVIFNSFYELEPEYLDRYKEIFGGNAWHVGPLSLCNDKIDEAHRGKIASIDEQECRKWLDSKNPNSVIYLCFGSIAEFSDSQLHEIASALEVSGQEFIWVVKKSFTGDEKWLPEGFKERTKGKGLIINGWAPQLLILSHAAVGAFVTHCGWNSTLEAVAAGVPMVTWPLFAEQFYNEKLVTDVLKVGIPVGNRKWSVGVHDDEVKREEIAKALERIMSNVESLEIRRRAGELGEIARKAVEPGGSSCSDLSCLLQELCAYHQSSCSK